MYLKKIMGNLVLIAVLSVVSHSGFAYAYTYFSNLSVGRNGGDYYLKFKTGATAHSFEIQVSRNAGYSWGSIASFSYIDFKQGDYVYRDISDEDGIYQYRVRHTAPDGNYSDWQYTGVTIGTPPPYGSKGGVGVLANNLCGYQSFVNPVETDDSYLSYKACNIGFIYDVKNNFGLESLPDFEFCSPTSVSGRIMNSMWLLKNIAGDAGPALLKNSYGWAAGKIDQTKPVCTYDCGHVGPFSGFSQPDAIACNTLTKNFFSLTWHNSYRVRLYDELIMNDKYSALARAAVIIHEARHTDTSSGTDAAEALLSGESVEGTVVHPAWPIGPHSYQFIWLAWVAAAANPIFGDEIRIEAAALANEIRADSVYGFADKTPEITPNLTNKTITNFNTTSWVLPNYQIVSTPTAPTTSGSGCQWTSMWGAPGVTVYQAVGSCQYRYKEVYSNGSVKYVR